MIGHGQYNLDAALLAQGSERVLAALLADEQIEEVMYNGVDRPFVILHRAHGPCVVNASLSERFCREFAQGLAAQQATVLDKSNPVLEGTLPDGSRIHITVPPVSPHGVTFTIRKFLVRALTLADLVKQGMLDADVGAFLWSCVDGCRRAPMNVLIVGGTGTGKTTFLNALTHVIPPSERMVVIEDTQEIRLLHENAVRLVATREANMDHLLRSALRMRPDRILVGEVRGPEAGTLVTAMNTGHRGCLGTLHANSAQEALERLRHPPMAVPMSQMAGLDLVVALSHWASPGGSRRVVHDIAEVTGHGDGVVRSNRLFAWDPKRAALGPTGVPSRKRALLSRALGVDHATFEAGLRRRAEALQQAAREGLDAPAFAHMVTTV